MLCGELRQNAEKWDVVLNIIHDKISGGTGMVLKIIFCNLCKIVCSVEVGPQISATLTVFYLTKFKKNIACWEVESNA